MSILEETFEVKGIDEEAEKLGKKFEKVSRIRALSENEMELYLDINIEIYPVELNNKLKVCLATTLELDGSIKEASKQYDPQLGSDEKPSLMDRYEYVMHGRVYNYKEENDKVVVYISFGGLLMKLKGEARNLQQIDPDVHLYLLIRQEI